jgi:hypothetical protein
MAIVHLSIFFLFLLALQPKSGPGHLIVQVSWSHAQLDTQPVVETATYTTHNKHKRRISMPSTGFKLAIPAIKRLHTYAIDCTATGIDV